MCTLEPEPFSAEERATTFQRRALEANASWRLFFSDMPPALDPPPIATRPDEKKESLKWENLQVILN